MVGYTHSLKLVQWKASGCKRSLAFIACLPPEILGEIFMLSLPPDLEDRIPSLDTPPLSISHVCTLWRDIALRTPRLWSALTIDPNQYHFVPFTIERFVELAGRWFSRAGKKHGLSFYFEDTAERRDVDFSDWILSYRRREKPDEPLLPWRQLTSLSLDLIQPHIWVQIMAQCTNLERGSFGINGMRPNSQPVDVELPHLTSLTLKLSRGFSFSIFDGFSLPALTTLDLHHAPNFWWSHATHLYSNLEELRSLRFKGSMKNLRELLHHTPSLVSLHYATDDPMGSFMLLRSLTVAEQSSPLVPRLELFSIRAGMSVLFPSCIVSMVLSRTGQSQSDGTVSPLREVKISVPGSDDPQDSIDNLEEKLRGQGATGTLAVKFVVAREP